ncbi:MAG: methyltransferase domain-containing protein [Pseudomonadota bacterium]
METLETRVAAHYTTQDLMERIDKALRDQGVDAVSVDDLKPVDEFHTGGLESTDALLSQLDITAETKVLDIGCGLGGTARHIVHRYGAHVTGIDLTPLFVEVGQALNKQVHLDEAIDLQVASAIELPMKDRGFDLVTMFHVGMNIADKEHLFAEVARVLKSDGRFALFDVMRDDNPDDLVFPLPWSEWSETSFVDEPSIYEEAAKAVGLTLHARRYRRDFALSYFAHVFAAIEKSGGPPPLGIHLLMGDTAGEKLKNYVANVEAHRIAPVEMIFDKP